MNQREETKDEGESKFGELDLVSSLSKLSSGEYFDFVSDLLKNKFNCETVVILQWNAPEALLFTKGRAGLPEGLNREENYRLNEGITGKYPLADQNLVRCIVDLNSRSITNQNSKCDLVDKSIRWDYIQNYGRRSSYNDFRSFLFIPFRLRGRLEGVVKLLNKLSENQNALDKDGFSKQDEENCVDYLSKFEAVLAAKVNEEKLQSLFSLSQNLSVNLKDIESVFEDVAKICAEILNYGLCVVRLIDFGANDPKIVAMFPERTSPFSAIDMSELTNGWTSLTPCQTDCDSTPTQSDHSNPPIADKTKYFEGGFGSALAVPIICDGQLIGYIECYTYIKRNFPKSEIRTIQTYANSILTTVYRQSRVQEALEHLATPLYFNSNLNDIYQKTLELVEKYFNTNFVSIWRKITTKNGFHLKLIYASEPFQSKCKEANISKLSPISLTGIAINKRSITQVGHDEIANDSLEYSSFCIKHGFKSLVIVPIWSEVESILVVDIFRTQDARLIEEERSFLQLLASKVSSAVRHVNLVNSSTNISEHLIPENEDHVHVLEKLTEEALNVLNANPVVIFQYDPEEQSFLHGMIYSGQLFYKNVKEFTNQITDEDLASKILESGTKYFCNKREFQDFLKGVNRNWQSKHYSVDFWTREKIKSLAAVRLKYKRDLVGVLFVNYRSSNNFRGLSKILIQSFARQAETIIGYTILAKQNQKLWESRRRDSVSLTGSELVRMLAHNTANHFVNPINLNFALLKTELRKGKGGEVIWKDVQKLVDRIDVPLSGLAGEFEKILKFTKGLIEDFRPKFNQIEAVIDTSIDMLQVVSERRNISIKKLELPRTPKILFDHDQIRHLLMNLLKNAINAIHRNGTITIGVDTPNNEGFIRLRVTDNGRGIPPELHSRIFEPDFTRTISGDGSGLGLPISKYIVERHGGRIDFRANQGGKGTTFYVYLPTKLKEVSK